MGTLLQLQQKAKSLNEEVITKELLSILKRSQSQIVKRNQDQLIRGENADGSELFSQKTQRGTYSKLTEQLSGGRKKEGDHYTLFDTGEFFQGFQLFQTNDSLEFISTDSKYTDLVSDFGIEIVGLNTENLEAVIRVDALPFLRTFLRKRLDI